MLAPSVAKAPSYIDPFCCCECDRECAAVNYNKYACNVKVGGRRSGRGRGDRFLWRVFATAGARSGHGSELCDCPARLVCAYFISDYIFPGDRAFFPIGTPQCNVYRLYSSFLCSSFEKL